MPRDEFLDYVKENHTAESNINEELVAKTIDFAGHDLKRKEEIAATVADNFTKEEIRKMTEQGDLLVVHGEKVVKDPDSKKKVDAAHYYRTQDGACKIGINDDADQTGITHEFVHHMRVEDSDRKGLSKTAYELDDSGCVIGESRSEVKTFAEECAVVAETEIRTKRHTDKPNDNVCNLDAQPMNTKDRSAKEWSYEIERSTMRTKAAAIKSNENIPVYRKAPDKDMMAEGVNLRGERAIKMFERNFRRSRLGYAPKTAVDNAKSNVDVIEDSHRKKTKKTE